MSRLIGLALIVALVYGGVWLYTTLSEVGIMGLFQQNAASSSQTKVHLKEQPVYKIKKKQELLGVNVIRIISRQQPEEFLVLDGVRRPLLDKVYGKPVDSFWATQMASQLLKLRETGEEGTPLSVEIQSVKPLASQQIEYQGHQIPCWQLEIQFKLSNESQPRYYRAGMLRNVRQTSLALRTMHPQALAEQGAGNSAALQAEASNPSGLQNASDGADQDTVLIGYAPKETFQNELLLDLMQHLQFE